MSVGRVIGTEDAMPLQFWVAVAEGHYLQLDDVVALERVLPDGRCVRIFGVVTQVRARHEGARFDSDVFLIADGVLPAQLSQAAQGRMVGLVTHVQDLAERVPVQFRVRKGPNGSEVERLTQ